MVAVRRPARPDQRMIMAMLFWTVPASFVVSLLLALVQLAINVHDDVIGKSIGPILLVWVSAPVVLPMAVAAGYLVVRVWTAAVWLAIARSADPTKTAGEAFAAARGLCRLTALVYTAGLVVLASLLVAGSAEFGVLSHASQLFQATLITAGPTGALAPVALLALPAVRQRPLRRGQAGSLTKLVLLSVCAIAYSALIGFAVAPLLLSSAGGKIIGALVVSAATVPAGAMLISQGTARFLRE